LESTSLPRFRRAVGLLPIYDCPSWTLILNGALAVGICDLISYSSYLGQLMRLVINLLISVNELSFELLVHIV
jgi:hypothetical protein